MRKRKHMGYWSNEENLLKEVYSIMDNHRLIRFPGEKKLRKMGYFSFCKAASKLYGGMREFRESIGQEQLKRDNGLLEDLEYVIKKINSIITENKLESLPTDVKLRELGYSSLSYAISKYHGGFSRFRELLGEHPREIPKGQWKDFEFVKKYVLKFQEKNNLDSLPGKDRMRKLGHSSLMSAINRYHGGLRVFRDKIGQKQKIMPFGSWQDLDFVINYSQNIIKEHKREILPTFKELCALGYSSLAVAISKYHGGFPIFRQLLNERLGIPSNQVRLEKILDQYIGGQDEIR